MLPISLIYQALKQFEFIVFELNSLSLFKRRIKDKFGYKRPPPHYYLGLRAASIWHTRLCLGMS